MKIGIIGLGKMGGAIAELLIDAGHDVVGFDFSKDACEHSADYGVQIVPDIAHVAQQARVIWLMVPAGDPVDQVIAQLMPQLQSNDIIVDGGNSNFNDSIRRAKELLTKNIFFLDCGTSGGVHGRANGFCLMVGGDHDAYTKIHPLLSDMAAPGGVGYFGKSGTGHYVKMVHNGIEYGLLEAYAEGFELIKNGTFKEEGIDLEEVTRVWNNGSVIRSFILALSHNIFMHDQKFEKISGEINESGTGQWTVDEARKNNIAVPVIEASLDVRAQSRKTGGNYATKVVSLLRNAFGGHAVKTK
jgi:6-phosphogluconate dehydrogenase